jgi:hypothetical protein
MLLWAVPILLSGVILAWTLWPGPVRTSHGRLGYDDIVPVIRLVTGLAAISLVWTATLLLTLLMFAP